MVETSYDRAFYDFRAEGSLRSANVLLSLLAKHYRADSVIDVGCGRGTWLSAALQLGVNRAVGLDGAWVENQILDPRIEFRAVDLTDLTSQIEVDEHFDLAISLEVAEHLPETRADAFVEFLCHRADVVIFGAATKLQGSTNHINEQWQSYWVARFEDKGYVCIYLFRQSSWGNNEVAWWYQQNAFLFVKKDAELSLLKLSQQFPPTMLDVVHPENFLPKVSGYHRAMTSPDLKLCARLFNRYIAIKLGLVN